MEQLAPRQVTIRIKDLEMPGMLSGSHDVVKFESINENFLRYFPEGRFDTTVLDKNTLSKEQQEIIEVALGQLRMALNHR